LFFTESFSIGAVILFILREISSPNGLYEEFEEDTDDIEQRPWKLSHVNFVKSTMKKGHIKVMKNNHLHDISSVRLGGEDIILHLKNRRW
jgi:hypothetical protein